MAWTTPKTNWVASDPITYEDYNRIKNNLYIVQNLCADLYSLSKLILGSDVTASEIPYADMLNTIEDCLYRVNRASYNFDIGAKTTFSANLPYFTYTELNRVESATLKIKQFLDVQKANIPRLAFTLGNYRGIIV